jgi:methylenetetrahydrofolate reductase (NADPH)
LSDTIDSLADLHPPFVSVTCGASETTRKLTFDALKALSQSTNLSVAAHLTCVGSSKETVLEIAVDFATKGIRKIVALRRDPPKGEPYLVQHPEGFKDTC